MFRLRSVREGDSSGLPDLSKSNPIGSPPPPGDPMSDAFIIDTCRTPRGIGKLGKGALADCRSEEHTSELQSPRTISYAVVCL